MSTIFRRAQYFSTRYKGQRSVSCHPKIVSSILSRSTEIRPLRGSSGHNFTSIYFYSTKNGRFWKHIENKSPNSSASLFTLMSYNILAQHHIDSQPSLYHSHDKESLSWSHRFDAIKSEINEIKPDILCLQEVQQNHLEQITDFFNDLGYDTSLYKKRTGLQVDGCAIYFKKDIFDLEESHFVDYFQPDIKILNRCNVAIIAKFALKSKPNTKFVVSTTHLLFNPKRHDIRLAQMQVLLAELDRIGRDGHNTDRALPIILTGDFNMQQTSEVFRLIIGESVTPRTLFEKMNFKFGIGRKNLLPPEMGISDECQHLDVVVHSDRYRTALHTSAQHETDGSKVVRKRSIGSDEIKESKLPFDTGVIQHKLNLVPTICPKRPIQIDTEHASTFHSKWIMVDYIFYSESNQLASNLRLLENYQLPTIVECMCTGPIPNETLGSDHYSIAARFEIE